MKVVETVSGIRETLANMRTAPGKRLKVGFVPTMGYLHEGHQSLLSKAKAECDIVVLSIFVNPLQFGPNEDFDKYPRDSERDLRLAEQSGCDVVFMPSVQEMYPNPIRTSVSVKGVTERLCGASRPGHFDGVAAVVLKLFHIVQPDKAYFGLKDAQQVAVISQMVSDLNVPVDIVPCPILREADGLAMSSRNVYLSAEERREALVLSKALGMAERLAQEEGLTFEALRNKIEGEIRSTPLADIDYIEVLSYPELEPVDPSMETVSRTSDMIVALAVKFGKTRLIDNVILHRK
ncbi:pantoate--beta-alanine ligase [Paenibacillus gansuensis]|uniref:Pantothenate synthetase n=1 Tax=Paenibacillus gansuensis TaxID=306542 RepID=A0ABW5PAB0_9BACL